VAYACRNYTIFCRRKYIVIETGDRFATHTHCIIKRAVINKRHLAVWPMLNIVRPKEINMRSLVILVCTIGAAAAQCVPSATTAIGTKAPATICSGDLIFDEEFDTFHLSVWNHEKTASGGGVSNMTCISPQLEVPGLWGCDPVSLGYCLQCFEGPRSLKRPLWKPFVLVEWTGASPQRKLEIVFMKSIPLCH